MSYRGDTPSRPFRPHPPRRDQFQEVEIGYDRYRSEPSVLFTKTFLSGFIIGAVLMLALMKLAPIWTSQLGFLLK